METPQNIHQKSDANLIHELKTLVAKERAILTEVLNYLAEVEKRRLYLDKGFSSMFAFMTEDLGYSESAAQRRIAAMRLIRDVPEAKTKIESGAMSLTVASHVGSYLRQEAQTRRTQQEKQVTREEKLNLLETLQGTSSRECEKKLAEIAPEICLPKEKTRPITPEKTLVQFTAGQGLMKQIEKLKALVSHQNKTGSLEELFSIISEIALDKLDPEKREARRAKRESKKTSSENNLPPAPEVKREEPTRYIPQALRDKIWQRDQAKCQHRDPRTGKTCGSTQRLEIDHVYPYALGGETNEANLQLKCRPHNQWRAGLIFGDRFPLLGEEEVGGGSKC